MLAVLDKPRDASVSSSSGFFVDDPLAARQWHLAYVRAFDFWAELPLLEPVIVAVIDTGIDLGHPDLADNILAAKSFVGGSADDPLGHGTFVSGLIAAELDNAEGVAGMAFPARLLVARVATADGDIDAVVEAKAIRWAVNRGARVINLSIGGLRDPLNRSRDTYSQEEAEAIAYAHSKGAVVVASVGNGDSAPSRPWPFASYPAALPHVIGVSAVAPSGAVPGFSNRDAVFNDLSAPGQRLVSTAPRKLTAERPSCLDQGYSVCASPDLRDGAGTSFSAAQVTAAAAILLAVNPKLAPEQVAAIVERSAADARPVTGCTPCPAGRDSRSGWGTLDVTAALEALAEPLPPADRYESNDDAGSRAATMYGRERTVRATLDFWDDQVDVYRVNVRRGERLKAFLRGPAETQTNLILWRPGTQHVEGFSTQVQRMRVTQSARAGPNEAFVHERAGGWLVLRPGEDGRPGLRPLLLASREDSLNVGVQLPEVERDVRWPEYVAMARAAEEAGFESIWLGDHLLYRGDGREERGPWEAWTMLAALATVTERVRLGPLVACASFHPPGLIAKMAATVDEISGGRFVLGLGAGSVEIEHTIFGLPVERRVSRFAESFEIVRRLLAGERVTFEGRYWSADDAVLLPEPARRVPLMAGSIGPRMLGLTLPHVDWWNTWYTWYGNTAEGFAELNARIDDACEQAARDPGEIARSACLLVQLDSGAVKRPHDADTAPVAVDDLPDALRDLEAAGADEVILVLRPITEASIRELGALF